ncbi:MAG: amidohydrolase [Gemmatimonadales bacterium]|nr:amidohydrolase [Gemmatimonadales bacterium]
MAPRAATAALLLLALPNAAWAQADLVLRGLDAKREEYGAVARKIWEFAEVGYQEEKSSALLQAQLKGAGFTVQAGVAEVPTAFVATYGSGKPVIAIVGEFDALPGLSQDAVPVRKVLYDGGPGHGCGHHLFGTAAAAAAVSVKDWLVAGKRAGTVRFYGTPAEEGGGGKIYMVRAGLFKDVDAVVSWHPGDVNQITRATTLANTSAKFRFHGVSAHAAAAPEQGRSALDAVEAMNHMVNLMREHVPAETRIHYIITNGGKAPNVVPDFAEVYYYARHSDMRLLDGIWERIVNAAKGAAQGTGTTMDFELVNSVYNVLTNDALSDVMQRALDQVGGLKYTSEESAFARQIRTTLSGTLPPEGTEEKVLPPEVGVSSGSTDMGDLSWVVPTVQLSAATWVPGTPAHSWQAVAAGGMSIGTNGMMVAAKTMALTAIALFQEPSHLQKARAEFERRLGGFVYKSRVGDRKPPLDYRKASQ